jgi:hypothetical protein
VDAIKQVVSVSIGSSRRDHSVKIDILGEPFIVQREGTDGDMDAAVARLRELDGQVDAFGLGGIDLYLEAAGRKYYFRDARRFGRAVSQTPIVDGSGLKGAVEGDVVRYMREDLGLDLRGKRVLLTQAVDRWGMAEAFADAGCEMTYGDMLFGLGINLMIHDRRMLERFVRTLMPVARQLPFTWLYPVTTDHTTEVDDEPKYGYLYEQADIVVGDYKYVRKWLPADMRGKWVVTNTTTAEDVEFLRRRGVDLLVTSTPRLDGRSFGANVLEAILVAYEGASGPLTQSRYMELMRTIGFSPDVKWLQRSHAA